jgi:hypothetical protein
MDAKFRLFFVPFFKTAILDIYIYIYPLNLIEKQNMNIHEIIEMLFQRRMRIQILISNYKLYLCNKMNIYEIHLFNTEINF